MPTKLLHLIGTVCLIANLYAQLPDSLTRPTPEFPRIFHIPPSSLRADTVSILACVVESGGLNLKAIKIFLRTDREENTKEIALTYSRGAYSVKLIPEMLQGKYLYYYFVAEFSDGRLVALPTEKPEQKPFSVAIKTTKP